MQIVSVDFPEYRSLYPFTHDPVQEIFQNFVGLDCMCERALICINYFDHIFNYNKNWFYTNKLILHNFTCVTVLVRVLFQCDKRGIVRFILCWRDIGVHQVCSKVLSINNPPFTARTCCHGDGTFHNPLTMNVITAPASACTLSAQWALAKRYGYAKGPAAWLNTRQYSDRLRASLPLVTQHYI